MTRTDTSSQAGPEAGALTRWAGWLVLSVLGFLWLRLINHLRVEWTTNEQYAYGWAVPFLCVLLIWRRFQKAEKLKTEILKAGSFSLSVFQLFSFLLFLLTRWIEEANPDWRLVSWSLALEVIGFTLAMLALAVGTTRLKHFAIPILFFLVAVPWPTLIEHPVIQLLTRAIVSATVELLNVFGLAALPHGNVIETARGLVDVDEACSGIRSLQAALMLALFFGEWRRLAARRRAALCGAAVALACLFNLARTVTMSVVAARQGTAAAQHWHDPAGVVILLGCFAGVWLVSVWLGQGGKQVLSAQCSAINNQWRAWPAKWMAAGLSLALITGEVAIQLWYASAPRAATPEWRAEWPPGLPGLKAIELPPAARRILRFNEGLSGAWTPGDGTRWQMIYLRWQPGRVATTLARNHTPEICLTAAGKKLRDVSATIRIDAAGLALPFRCYTTEQNGQPLFVFYSLWEDGGRTQRVTTELLTWRARFDAVLERRRNPGQRVLEIAIWGARDAAHAEELLRAELPKLIHVKAETLKN